MFSTNHNVYIHDMLLCFHRFELSWPGHILTVTPQNGMIEPKSQVVVLVSVRHSIYSRGVELPWSGHLHIKCDGNQQVRYLKKILFSLNLWLTFRIPYHFLHLCKCMGCSSKFPLKICSGRIC